MTYASLRHRSCPPRRCSGRPRRDRAFTLLELMVVIGIIAILASMLLPLVSRARAQSRSVSCESNLKNIYTAAVAWQAQNGRQPQDFTAAGWTARVLPLLDNKKPALMCAGVNYSIDGSGNIVSAGADQGDLGATDGTNSKVSNLAVHIVNTNYDIPCVEGKFVKKENVTGNSYELSFEDQAAEGGGDWSYNNVRLKFTDNGDGTITITVEQSFGGYTSNLIDATTGKVLLNNVGQNAGSVNIGKTYTVQTGAIPTSYAVNGDIGLPGMWGKGDKIFALDYNSSVVVQTTSDDWSSNTFTNGQGALKFARHNNNANICWADGRVTSEHPTKTVYNPAIAANRSAYWDPK